MTGEFERNENVDQDHFGIYFAASESFGQASRDDIRHLTQNEAQVSQATMTEFGGLEITNGSNENKVSKNSKGEQIENLGDNFEIPPDRQKLGPPMR